jgi:hypothetical protein
MADMTRGEFLHLLSEYAKIYVPEAVASVTRNHHMNDLTGGKIYYNTPPVLEVEVDQRVVDAVVVDFINFIGEKMWVDYGMYTKDLREKKDD